MFERYSFSEDSVYIGAGLGHLLEKSPGETANYPIYEGERAAKDYCQMVG